MQNLKFSIPPQNIFPQAFEKLSPPPSQIIISKIFIPPQMFGVKLYYGTAPRKAAKVQNWIKTEMG